MDSGEAAGRKKIDIGKVLALKKAGWRIKDIAGEMSCSEATIYNHLKKEDLKDE